MNFPRSLTHALLSLLLLFAQQIGLTHAITHLGERDLTGQFQQEWQASERGVPKSIGSKNDCVQCHAVAQIAFAAVTNILAFVPDGASAIAIAAPVTVLACLVTVCVFQSRAPPLA